MKWQGHGDMDLDLDLNPKKAGAPGPDHHARGSASGPRFETAYCSSVS